MPEGRRTHSCAKSVGQHTSAARQLTGSSVHANSPVDDGGFSSASSRVWWLMGVASFPNEDAPSRVVEAGGPLWETPVMVEPVPGGDGGMEAPSARAPSARAPSARPPSAWAPAPVPAASSSGIGQRRLAHGWRCRATALRCSGPTSATSALLCSSSSCRAYPSSPPTGGRADGSIVEEILKIFRAKGGPRTVQEAVRYLKDLSYGSLRCSKGESVRT